MVTLITDDGYPASDRLTSPRKKLHYLVVDGMIRRRGELVRFEALIYKSAVEKLMFPGLVHCPVTRSRGEDHTIFFISKCPPFSQV